MSVLIATNLGDIVIDLYTDKCPLTCKNFLKLCKIKYYNDCIFHTVQKDFIAQTGDPKGTGTGGDSIYKFLYGDQARFFPDEIHHELTHSKKGTVAMASGGENLNASQFYITLRKDLDYLDGKHTVFGEVAEGFDVLSKINEAYVDSQNKPYKNIGIKDITILEDPFEDPPKLAELMIPNGSPKEEVDEDDRIEINEEAMKEKAAHSSALVLESLGDIPEAEANPPKNVLYVCKLNPATEEGDLGIIFSKFGKVVSVNVIRDFKTGESLCYGFVGFENEEECDKAYRKIKENNLKIDDRHIHVDFTQSVSKLWSKLKFKRKGKENRGDGGYYNMVFESDEHESPKRKKKKRDYTHEKEKIRRRSYHGFGSEGKRKRRDDTEEKTDKYNGRRQHRDEVIEETYREQRKRQWRR